MENNIPEAPRPSFWSRPNSLMSSRRSTDSGTKSIPVRLRGNKRKSFAMLPSLLGDSRRNGRPSKESDLSGETQLSKAKATVVPLPQLPSSSENIIPDSTPPKPSPRPSRQSKPLPSSQARSQPPRAGGGFLKRITSTFRKPSSSKGTPPPKAPPKDVPDTMRLQREAALRERGLLPPLKPNKDLSELEREQDRLLTVVSPTPDSPSSGDPGENVISEADRIKQEYEEKTRAAEESELKRFKTFKFGGSSTSLTLTPVDEESSSLRTPTRSRRSPSPAARLLIPQSPIDSVFNKACSLPLPPSPSPRDTSPFRTSPLSPTLPLPEPPVVVEPDTEPAQPSVPAPSDDNCLAPPLARTHSNTLPPPSESDGSSIATPSLVSSSSTLNTSSLHSINTSPSVLKSRIQDEMNNIPVIVESPGEEGTESDLPPTPTPPPKRSQTLPPTQQSNLASRRKSLFNKTIDVPPPSRRLSIANVRRSVVGSLSRPSRDRKFDGSKLPPSPSLPEHSKPASPRRAVSPTMHSRGSILIETAGIEDEESRRMTEMAFLG